MLSHLAELTTAGLAEHPEADLIVWPESSVRPINPESRGLPITGDYLDLIQTSHRILVRLSEFGPALLVGGSYSGDWQRVGESMRPDDRRNSVYFYREGQQQRERYDKQHLFPFGEYIPFRDQPPPIGWAYEFFQLFNPWGGDHSLTPGVQDTIFSVAGARIITPICFEDIIPYKVRQLTYADGQKRADVLVNVTNDGWFRWNQMEQHLQAAAFRSIENRLPTARSVNTGGTAIIDPDGRIRDRVSSGESGFVIGTVQLDSRHSIYGRIGDAFGFACVVMAFGGWIFLLIDRFRRRRRVEARPSDVSAPQAPDR
jgi:apolipoprotein N-acyltransferase